MESRTKLLGHPVHPMLIVFPLGLLSASVIVDVIARLTNCARCAEVGYWKLVGGLLGGLVAAPFGLLDWLAVPEGTRAKEIGRWHGLGNALVLGLFGASWLARRDDPGARRTLPFVLALLGTGVAMLTAWLGGELVYRLTVGVDADAHLDAPNSLTGEPADMLPAAEPEAETAGPAEIH